MGYLIEYFSIITAWHWFGLALLLVILEVMLGTSFFLISIGVSAAVIGLILLIVPSMTWEYQFLSFACTTVLCLVYWKSHFKNSKLTSGDPTLNRRNEQYVGRVVTLGEPLVNGRGRIQIDDSYWRVEGQDLPIGTAVKIVGVDGVVLRIEKV